MKYTLPAFFPNFLSCLRIVIGIVIPLLIIPPRSLETLPLVSALFLFIFGALTDFWDGWVARRHRLETAFGRILDPLADKVFILATMASFAARGLYSYWWLVPIFLRETAVTFCRLAWLAEGQAIGAERAGKVKLGLQVVSISFSFLYLLFGGFFSAGLNLFFLVLAMAVTVSSGVSFLAHNRRLLEGRNFLGTVSALGVGYLRPAPGTYGTLLGLLVIPLIAHDLLLHVLILVLFIALYYFTIPRLGLAHEADPTEIVIDEFCGILLAFVGRPITPASLLVGFILFRIFDVTKLFPINWLENRKGTHGILWDDLGAGVYTWLILKLVYG